ncbi:Uncharacterised protein [Chlamydia trachomatis]|nr:Uncharacterised protein [Chlamydia trachomatis]
MVTQFDNDKHRKATLAIAKEYENRIKQKDRFYVQVPFWQLPETCQQEHVEVARAALANKTYNGHTLPTWVKRIAEGS